VLHWKYLMVLILLAIDLFVPEKTTLITHVMISHSSSMQAIG
jgi:hypothetical protein